MLLDNNDDRADFDSERWSKEWVFEMDFAFLSYNIWTDGPQAIQPERAAEYEMSPGSWEEVAKTTNELSFGPSAEHRLGELRMSNIFEGGGTEGDKIALFA